MVKYSKSFFLVTQPIKVTAIARFGSKIAVEGCVPCAVHPSLECVDIGLQCATIGGATYENDVIKKAQACSISLTGLRQ